MPVFQGMIEARAPSAESCAVAWFTVSIDHPALAGHFPGRPVVPGVLLLDHVLQVLQRYAVHRHVAGLPVVKFLRPVLPQEEFMVGLELIDATRLRFVCRCAGQLAAHGTATLA